MKIQFLKSKKWTIPLLVALIILAIGIFIQFSLGFTNFENFFLNTFSQNPFKKQSQVNVSIVDNKLNLNFELIDEDKTPFKSFINNWFGVDEEVKSLSFGIDENLKSQIAPNLPVDLNMEVSEKQLDFKSQSISPLQNPLVKTDIDFATGSGSLKVKYTDNSKYQIQIENPDELVRYATSSGILAVSSKISGLFQTLPKISTIELILNGKNIAGKIVLK